MLANDANLCVFTIFGKEVGSFFPQEDAGELSLTRQAVAVLHGRENRKRKTLKRDRANKLYTVCVISICSDVTVGCRSVRAEAETPRGSTNRAGISDSRRDID